MKHASLLGLLCMALLVTACDEKVQAEDRNNPATAHLDGEAKRVADWLIAGQHAGWQDQDYATFKQMWADDAVRVWARSEQEGKRDWSIKADRFLPACKIMMSGPDAGEKLVFSDVAVQIDGQTATLTCKIAITYEITDYKEWVGQRYKLKRTDTGWIITDDRFWLIAAFENGEKTVFTKEVWEQRDREVAEAAAGDDPRRHVQALLSAYRTNEAYDAIKNVTKRDDAMAIDWAMRGFIATIAAVPNDAEPSFERALELDPDVWLPHFAKPRQ